MSTAAAKSPAPGIAKTFTLNTGGTLSPGGDGANSNIGTLTSSGGGPSSHAWSGGSTYIWEISNAGTSPTGAGGTFDSLSVTGTLTVNATSASPMTIKVVSHGAVTGFNGGQPWNWTIASATSVSGFVANKFVLDVSDFIDDNGSANPAGFSMTQSGGAIRVSYVPEPAATVFAAAGGVVVMLRRRRRQ
jgi:hypothetical protein